MNRMMRAFAIVVVCSFMAGAAVAEPAGKLVVSAKVAAILDHIYSGQSDQARNEISELETALPDDPLGYLLEAEMDWWQIWCMSAEFKYGMSMARRHEKNPGDEHYFALTKRAYTLAEAKIHEQDSGEMRLYAAMADALAARLYAMRSEYRASAHAGVRARENFLVSLKFDPNLADAYTGLGLYNYYVDTLSMLARAMRVLMGIPGGSKEEGIRQLERGMREGQLSGSLARFYLALNLFNYDQKYERALEVIGPLVEKYPGNPVFQLMRGDLNAKLGRRELAENCYRAAEKAAGELSDAECRAKMGRLAHESMEALERK
jgi:hypothetical protein